MSWWLLCCYFIVASSALDPPSVPLLKQKLLAELAALPNYTCTQTIERSYKPAHKRRFEPTDRIRIEVAVIGGREVFGWPGGGTFKESDITDLVPGFIGSGDFSNQARGLLTASPADFRPAGFASWHGRPALRFDYRVPQESSRWVLLAPAHVPGTERLQVVVGHRGSIWLASRSLELLELTISADDLPPWMENKSLTRVVRYKPVRSAQPISFSRSKPK